MGFAIVLTVFACSAAAIGSAELAIAALSLALGAFGAASAFDRRRMLRLLSTQHAAQKASFERLRLVLSAVERREPDPGATARSDIPDDMQLDPVSTELAELVAGVERGARVLCVGTGRIACVPPSVERLEVVEPGVGALAERPHGLFSHVLIEPSCLQAADATDLRWLRRAFRWQHDTVIALPARAGRQGIETLGNAIEATLGVAERERVLSVRAPLGGGFGWGQHEHR